VISLLIVPAATTLEPSQAHTLNERTGTGGVSYGREVGGTRCRIDRPTRLDEQGVYIGGPAGGDLVNSYGVFLGHYVDRR
jgi:hypothetical protein